MSILPEGELLRRAVKWISGERSEHPEKTVPKLIGDACLKFDLSPKDADMLLRFFAESEAGGKDT